MKAESKQTRSAAMTATATTLVALVAVASSASAAVMPRAVHGHGQNHSHSEVRSIVLDTQTVRCVAEALAAAARDLLTSGQHEIALPTLYCSDELELPETVRVAHSPAASHPLRWLLGERLLDLPPPAC